MRFQKNGTAVNCSHLDLLRSIQRILRRAAWPVAYSQGFNPHPILSFAQALSLGMESFGEYFEVTLAQEADIDRLLRAFNENAPKGLWAKDARVMAQKEPSAMALVQGAEYRFVPAYDTDKPKVQRAYEALIAKESHPFVRRSKKGEKTVDMLPMVHDLRWEENDCYALLSCGEANLPPMAFWQAAEQLAGQEIPCRVDRQNLFTRRDGNTWASLMEAVIIEQTSRKDEL